MAPRGRGEQSGPPGVLSWGLGRERAINPPPPFAPAKEPEGASRNTKANTVCAQREGFHAGAITGVAVAGNAFLAVETWQRKLPVRSPTCCAAAPGWGGSGRLPGPSCPSPAEWGALFPNTALPYLIRTLAPWDAQWGDFVQRNGSNNAEKRTGRKWCQMLGIGSRRSWGESSLLAGAIKEPLFPGVGTEPGPPPHRGVRGRGVLEPLPRLCSPRGRLDAFVSDQEIKNGVCLAGDRAVGDKVLWLILLFAG